MNALAHPERAAVAARPQPALRFLTAGSVDDGKSTLIGRLLLDSRAILADQLEQLHARAAASGEAAADLSLLIDGLEAEREQGITIDVAWRYFATPARKFVIADAPGHEQYTRNMVTAAAGSDAVVVLVDITKLDLAHPEPALLPQTRRHALLAQLLRVDHLVFAVNKIDAVADPGVAFGRVAGALQRFAAAAALPLAGIVPVSALRGDNVAGRSPAPWYGGPSLLELLEALPCAHEPRQAPLALPVQHVARQGDGVGEQPRVLWGRVARGEIAVGDRVQVFPSGETATVQALLGLDGEVQATGAGRSAGVVLDRMLDVSRGDWLLGGGGIAPARALRATMAWLDTEPAQTGRRYLLRHGHRWVQARLRAVRHRLDIHTLAHEPADGLRVNDIGEVEFELQQPLPLLPYADSRIGGALIVVDPASQRTSGALLVREALPEAQA
ncbi:MAG: sulfate adenylyltransferase subunit 1 [Betaproteobacteria bacterium]